MANLRENPRDLELVLLGQEVEQEHIVAVPVLSPGRVGNHNELGDSILQTPVEDGLQGSMYRRSRVVGAGANGGEAVALDLGPQVASVKGVALAAPEGRLYCILNL